ncbi:MAG: ATP synthase F0 subunit B [Acidobacteriota bacterium]
MRKNALTLTLAAAGGLALATAASAAGPEASPTWLGVPRWVFAWLNLIVLWGFLWKAAGPMVRNFFDTRRKEIQDGLALAKNQRAQTEEMSADLDRQLAELKDELQEMVERNKTEGERERQEILAQAEQDKERLLEQADFEIRSRIAQAKASLAQATARGAADAAIAQVASDLSADDRERLFEVNLGRLREKLS